MARIPHENAEYLRSNGVTELALQIHEQSYPLDTHSDSMTTFWLFGIDLHKNQRETWKPRKRLFRYRFLKTLAPKGKHKPLFNHADLPRMIDGGFGGACLAGHASSNNAYPRVGNPWQKIMDQYQHLTQLANEQGSRLAIATTPDEFRHHVAAGKIAGIFSVEGAHCLGPVWPFTREKRLMRLEQLRTKYGAAYITVNHFASNDIATSSRSILRTNNPNKGVGRLADKFVATANRLGLVLDLSHTNRQGILDIVKRSSKPVVATHAGVYEIAEALTPGGKYNRRMLDIDSIKAIASTGGCVGVLFSPLYLNGKEKDGSLELVVRHYKRLKSEVGYEHICLGTDFDGFIASIPGEMRDAADLPLLTQKLLESRWTEHEIKALYCDNFLRVWEENLRT